MADRSQAGMAEQSKTQKNRTSKTGRVESPLPQKGNSMKAHLLSSDEPLKEGQDHSALCGQVVKKAQFVFFFDSDKFESFLEMLSPLRFCSKCARVEIVGRYIYALIPGQDVRQEQA